MIHFWHLMYFYFDAVKTLTLQHHTSMTDIAGCWKLLLYYYYTSNIVLFLFFHSLFFSIFKTKSPNSVRKAETRLVFHNYNKHFLIKEAFWWNLSPNLVKLTKRSVVIMTGICFLSFWTRLQIWTECNRNYQPSTWTTLLPHRSFHTCKLAMI